MAANVLFKNDIATATVREAQTHWILWQARVTPTARDIWEGDYVKFLASIEDDIVNDIIQPEMDRNQHLKISFSLCLRMEKFNLATEEITTIDNFFTSSIKSVTGGDNLNDLYASSIAEINRQLAAFTKKGSGWCATGVISLDINFARPDTFARRGFCLEIPELPHGLKSKKSILKIQGKHEGDCFYSAVLLTAYLAASDKCVRWKFRQRVDQLERLWERPDLADKRPVFPTDATLINVAVDEIYKFENDNPLYRILVLGYENGRPYPLRTFKHFKEDSMDDFIVLTLLFHENHYYPVRNLNAFLNDYSKYKRTGGYYRYCPFCLHGIWQKADYEQHIQFCCGNHIQAVEMPDPGSTVKFNKFFIMLEHPFLIVADSESILEKTDEKRGKTELMSKHVPCAVGYYLSISKDMEDTMQKIEDFKELLPEYPNGLYKEFVGKECMSQFLESLYDLTERLYRLTRFMKTPLKQPSQHYEKLQSAKVCYMCGDPFMEEVLAKTPVLDHCHISGRFRGVAHHDCNAKASWKKRLFPVIFHNWRGYDAHSLCKTAKFSTRDVFINCIPHTSEKYLSMILTWKVGEYLKEEKIIPLKNELRFIDSLQFLGTSLSSLVDQTREELGDDFKAIQTCCDVNESNKDCFFRKGVFPYAYMDSMERLEETQLPACEEFKSDLYINNECSEDDYAFAQHVWKTMKCSTIKDYTLFYMKTDVLLLADCFNNFRKTCLGFRQLDPVYFFSLPGFSWAAALKTSGIKLELLTDYEMYCMIEQGIRGGLSVATRHYTKAGKDEYGRHCEMGNWDANSLYATNMTDPLPYAGFHWVTEGWDELFPTDDMTAWPEDEDETGYILEVDLHYPDEIKNKTASYPLAPAKEAITEADLTPFMKEQFKRSCPASHKFKTEYKLMATQRDKERYVVHYRALKLYLELGLELTKIHRVVGFKQKRWLASYIHSNIEMRKKAKTTFQSDFLSSATQRFWQDTREQETTH